VTYSVAFSSDGSLLATGEDFGAVRFWSNPPGASPAPIDSTISFAGGDSVNAIAFTPNGTYLAAGGAFSVRQLSIYSVATHQEVDRTTPSGDVTALAVAPNGGAIIAGLDACGSVLVCN
jgi:WD40 repeat protein